VQACCEQDDRREAARQRVGWNGLDYVELGPQGHNLRAYFLGKLPPELADPKPDLARFLRLDGGVRITGIAITGVQPIVDPDPEQDDHLLISLDQEGDFSVYTLSLVGVANVDPRYGSADFHFRIDCPRDLDCAPVCACPPEAFDEPEINYLAKDYTGFRQLLLDRLALLMPGWKERHVPDLGITLVELLAYQGDMLSYYQDSVATEATLDTARMRVSVRRHARLVDYILHEGCNARAWLCFEVDSDIPLDPTKVAFLSGLADQQRPTILNWDDLAGVSSASYETFEPLVADLTKPIQLRAAHNSIHFHTFGQKLCCLERGCTSASLRDTGLILAPGDVLMFEEVRDPRTGLPADAYPSHRHVVRLTSVTRNLDPIMRSADDKPTPYVDITWSQEDALPFTLCLSAIGTLPNCPFIDDITIVRGNVLLVDHGRSVGPEDLGTVPTLEEQANCECPDVPGPVTRVPGTFRATLAGVPLTWRQRVHPAAPAATALQQDPRRAAPQVTVASAPPLAWHATPDLIESQPTDPAFVVETDDDGVARLRFGDGTLGLQPAAATQFSARYRIGNGPAGNIGAEAIRYLVLRDMTLTGVGITLRNPMPARGGAVAETIAEAKLLAPNAFRQRLERAITADDYATLAERDRHLQRAEARLVWTGSWYEACVAIDPLDTEEPTPDLLKRIKWELQRYRRILHDLRVLRAVYVPIDLRIEACALPGYRRADVKAALLASFGTKVLPDGSLGYGHPDALSFGDGLYLSQITARAQAIPGVECVTVTRLQRLYESSNQELENGLLPLAPWEIAQLDNDPNRPERGRLQIVVQGGH
jgi:hypothetical protein